MSLPSGRTLDGFSRDYRIAFLRYLARHEEVALTAGYALGRAAVADGVSLLELVRIHHEVLHLALSEGRPDELAATSAAASSFLLEVLAPFDMAHRRLLEPEPPPG
ncbi:MAG: phosphatase RsbU N-terminal domain-containing protein [Lapillicoccus sp.]